MLNRSEKKPYIFGDIFRHASGAEIIIVNPNIKTAYFRNKDFIALIHTIAPHNAMDLGFMPLEKNIEESKRILEFGLFAPRQLENNVWSALSPLAFTTAICIDYDDYCPFVSRYCFEDGSFLNRHENALLWLSRFDHSLNLPVGNVAYRGHLGSKPIIDETITKGYYKMLYDLQFKKSENYNSINEYARSFLDNYSFKALQDGLELLTPDGLNLNV